MVPDELDIEDDSDDDDDDFEPQQPHPPLPQPLIKQGPQVTMPGGRIAPDFVTLDGKLQRARQSTVRIFFIFLNLCLLLNLARRTPSGSNCSIDATKSSTV